MSRFMRRPQLLLVAVFLLGALLAGSGVVVAASVIKSGKAVTAVKVVTDAAAVSTASQTYADVPGMSLSVTVPSGEKAVLLITFSAQSRCLDGSGATAFCYARVLVDGNTALPGEVIFDSAADGNAANAYETNSMQFVVGPLNAGGHTVRVQTRVDEAVSSFTMAHRTLSVLRSRV